MKTSELIKALQKSLEDYGDVEVVKFYNYKYLPISKVVPIMIQETLGITNPVVSKVEVY